MDSYKVSEAWHVSRVLAADVLELAREALVELQEHLQLARDRGYVEQRAFEDMAG